MATLVDQIDQAIIKVPNFPHQGILYYDITGIFNKPLLFAQLIQHLQTRYQPQQPDAIAAIESRGFIHAAPLALALGVPLVLLRKAGKLPRITVGKSYALEYGKARIEVHIDDIPQGKKILIVDDLLASGGTMAAAVELLRGGGAIVEEVCAIIGLTFLGYQRALADVNHYTLVNYPLA